MYNACKCHNLPMQKNGHGGYRCKVRQMENQRLFRKRHPDKNYMNDLRCKTNRKRRELERS